MNLNAADGTGECYRWWAGEGEMTAHFSKQMAGGGSAKLPGGGDILGN